MIEIRGDKKVLITPISEEDLADNQNRRYCMAGRRSDDLP